MKRRAILFRMLYSPYFALFPSQDKDLRVTSDDVGFWHFIVIGLALLGLALQIAAKVFDGIAGFDVAVWKYAGMAIIAFLLCRLAVLENQVSDLKRELEEGFEDRPVAPLPS